MEELIEKTLQRCKEMFLENNELEIGDLSECDYTDYFTWINDVDISYSCMRAHEYILFDKDMDMDPCMEKALCAEDAWENHKGTVEAIITNIVDQDVSEDQLDDFNSDIEKFIKFCMIH